MQQSFKVNRHWLQKAAICLALLALLAPKPASAIGLPPIVIVPPLSTTVQAGDTLTLSTVVGVSLTPLSFKWRLDGSNIKQPNVVNTIDPILGITTSTLTVSNVSAANAGTYTVKVDNNGGMVITLGAVVVVNAASNVLTTVSILSNGTGKTNGGFRLHMQKPANSNLVVDASTDLVTWTPISTNSMVSTNVSYLDDAATNLLYRYYRARLQ
jgi:hypothetical protein